MDAEFRGPVLLSPNTYKGQLARDNRGAVLAEHSPCPICDVPLNAVLENG
jgi:hypothetical protein